MEEGATPGAGRRMGWWLLPVLALTAFRPSHAEESTCDGVCGRRPLAGSHNLLRVVGGSNVLPGTWPWMVSFQVLTRKGYTNFCGGSLISPRWVLSAAHCFQKPKQIRFIRLSIGAHRVSKPGPDAQRRSIKRLVNHKLYKRGSNNKVHNDISLVELNEPVNCTDYIQPACLPEDSMVVSLLKHCYVSGFGIMDSITGQKADIMQEGPVDIIPEAICSKPDWWSQAILEENICAGHIQGGIATCKGDSGGPLMCREQRSERYWVIGITSWGPSFCGQEKKPGVYISTQFYLDWIKKTTNMDFSQPNHEPLMAESQTTPLPPPFPRPQSQPVLAHFDKRPQVVLACDASPYGVGAILDWREMPVAYFSQTVSAAEQNYSQIDEEGLAIMKGVKKIHNFFYGHPFTVVTDHKPLLGLFTPKKQTPPKVLSPPPRPRWLPAIFLAGYQYALVRRPGKAMGHVDTLSQLPLPETSPDPAPTQEVMP
nr:acrosin-like [Zootoca vivipara]